MPALTIAGVARIKPPKAGQRDVFDKGHPGLALRVSYGGAKSWTYFYRLNGRQHRLALGALPAMGLADAREAWRAARAVVLAGGDPAAARQAATADSFAVVAEEWLVRDQAKNRSAKEARRVLEHDVLPVWRDRWIDNIKRADVIRVIDAVTDRGAPIMARRLHSHLHRLFRWAVGRGIIQVSPVADLPKTGSASERDRVLTDAELAAIWKAADKIGHPFGPAVQLLALTAARREEISALRWSEIHDDEIHLPGKRTKNDEPRIIPLAPAAVRLIAALPHIGEYVSSTKGKTPISGWSRAKKMLDAAAAENTRQTAGAMGCARSPAGSRHGYAAARRHRAPDG